MRQRAENQSIQFEYWFQSIWWYLFITVCRKQQWKIKKSYHSQMTKFQTNNSQNSPNFTLQVSLIWFFKYGWVEYLFLGWEIIHVVPARGGEVTYRFFFRSRELARYFKKKNYKSPAVCPRGDDLSWNCLVYNWSIIQLSGAIVCSLLTQNFQNVLQN